MLTEMAKMSLDDGLVLQIHPGSSRNHSPAMLARHGRDMGGDIPSRTDYVTALKHLLAAVGLESSEERRVGKECVRPCRSRLSPYTSKKTKTDRSTNYAHYSTNYSHALQHHNNNDP